MYDHSNRFNCLTKVKLKPNYLEILEKSQDAMSCVDEKTGELTQFSNNKVVPVDSAGLVDRYSLQSVARKVLKGNRVSHCMHSPASLSQEVGIHKNQKHNSVFFSGLQTCGSVWHCPVCAAKISERRAKEVQHAIEYTKNQNGFISFVTRTVPHTYTDSLKDILTNFRKADSILKADRYYKKSMKFYGVFASIKVFEITCGLNGWHLHTHELFFHHEEKVKKFSLLSDFYESFESSLYSVWSVAAVSAGFELPSRAHGLQVQNGDFAADYIAKFGREPQGNFWGSDREMTKQHIKKSTSGFSPFDLFRLYRESDSKEVESLILEYAETMKGARQLIWSRGFKKLIDLKEKTDVELALEQDEEAILMGVFTLEQWRFILKSDLKVSILLYAKYHGWDAMCQYLGSLGCPDFRSGGSSLPRLLVS